MALERLVPMGAFRAAYTGVSKDGFGFSRRSVLLISAVLTPLGPTINRTSAGTPGLLMGTRLIYIKNESFLLSRNSPGASHTEGVRVGAS